MQIVINIEKKHLWGFVFIFILFGTFVVAYNSGGTGGDPSVMGHSFDEMAAGTTTIDSEYMKIIGDGNNGENAIFVIEDTQPGSGTQKGLKVVGKAVVTSSFDVGGRITTESMTATERVSLYGGATMWNTLTLASYDCPGGATDCQLCYNNALAEVYTC